MKPVSTIHAKWSTPAIDTRGDRETLRQRSQKNIVSPYGNIGVPTAVGLPNLIPYMYYFWKKDVEEGYYVRTPEYHARQHIQRFIYAVNQPYVRDGIQSAFTNVSVFDTPYLEALFGGAEFPDGSFMIDSIDGIREFQKLFMEVVADIRTKNMFTYPVKLIAA